MPWRAWPIQDPRFHALFMIHDDISFLRPEKEIDNNAKTVIDTMLNCPFEWTKIVPISVEMSVGQTWDKLEEVGTYANDTWNMT